jgi:hypothetical protein
MAGAQRSRTAIHLGIAGIVASLIVTAMLLPNLRARLRSDRGAATTVESR